MTTRHTLNARRLSALLAAAIMGITTALTSAMPSAATVSTAQAGPCPGLSGYVTNPGTFSPSHHPVVLIHGWGGTSDSMWPVEQGLRKLMPDTFDFRYFDYRGNRSDWAARAPVASCLAKYINNISALQHDAGGDGKVYVVAHSMGGLAIRFATDKNTVPNPVPASALGGVVTIDTPHLGSVFGNTWMATMTQWWQEHHGQSLQPDHTSDADRCLAIHGPGTHLPSGCATPPYLPAGVPLAETAGTSTVRRTLFGIDLYDIPLSSDGVVSVDSAHGYRTSGVDGTKAPPPGASLPTISCTITSDQTMALLQAAARDAGLPGAIIGAEVKALQLLWKDGAILDAINAGQLTPDLEVLLGTALFFYPCGHNAVLGNATTLQDVATALRADLATQETVPAAAAPILGLGGTFVGLNQTDGDAAVAWLSAHFGRPDRDIPGMCDNRNMPGRRVSWGDLTILISSQPSAVQPAGLAGWTYGFRARPSGRPLLTTAAGIGVGATRTEVMKTYPDAVNQRGVSLADNLSVLRPAGQWLIMYLNPQGRVSSMESGASCGG